MANIPGIVGYVGPGAFSLVQTRPGPVSLPGGPTIIAILGQGRREEALVTRAAGGGADGAPVGFSPANNPDGRHFQLACFPVVPGTIEVFLNPVGDGTDLPLIQITSQAMAAAWTGEFSDTDSTPDSLALALGISSVTNLGPPSGTPAFGTARGYGILGASAVTGSTGAGSALFGNLGIAPGTAISNFPPSTFTGVQDVNNAAAIAAQASALATYTDLSTRPAGTVVGVLDGMTLTPGTYTSGSTMSLAGSGAATLTLNGAGIYIFQIGSAITTGSGGIPTINLTNGALASNVYWVVGSSATINSGFAGTFRGNVIAQASITVTLGGTVNGSLVALTGAVTLSNTTTINTQPLVNLTTSTTDSLDGYQGSDLGTGTFFNTKWGRQFQQLKQRLGIAAGVKEPNHYIFDQVTGRMVLDQALASNDSLIISYLCESDLNSPKLMFDLKSVIAKHGFPSFFNTISLAAQIAFENGAGAVMPVQAGLVINGLGSARRLVSEPTMATALKALEREELVEILVPIVGSRIYGEVSLAFYDTAIDGPLTSNGQFLQEDTLSGAPGLSVSPLAVIPAGQPNAGAPIFLNVYLNGRLLQYGVDYSVPNVTGTTAGPFATRNALIALDPTYPGATHSVDNTLVDGDRVTADYLPDPAVINLVATGQLSTLLHCQLMSQTKNRRERTCLLGAYEFVDLDFILDPVEGIVANFGQFFRSVFFYPGGFELTRVIAGSATTLDAQFIAAAAAGFVASNAIPTTMTNKTLQGFTIPPSQKLTVDETSLIGGAGVAIVLPLAAGGKVLHGLTTTSDGMAVHQEYSVVRISDYVAKTVRVALENAFIGKLITLNTPNDVKITTTNILSALVSQGVINSFASVDASVDPQEPRQIDVRFAITPVFPLNWIFIDFTIGA